jgi:hypothetical protein
MNKRCFRQGSDAICLASNRAIAEVVLMRQAGEVFKMTQNPMHAVWAG